MPIAESQEKLIDNYRDFILKAKFLRCFPEFAASSVEKEKLIRDRLDDFKQETLVLLACLEDLYTNIEINDETATIEGITKKISIAYYDKNRGYKGAKEGGKYSIFISLHKITQIYPNSIIDCISVKRPLKKHQKTNTATISSTSPKHIHPHINTASGVCWLNMKNNIFFLLTNFQFLEILLCTYEFLSHANLESCYNQDDFLQWKEVEQ